MESSPKTSFVPGCPYLGLKNDPSTSLTYPSTGNVCFHCQSPTIPKLEYQEHYCLTESHVECSVYHKPETKEFPVELKQIVVKPKQQTKPWQLPVLFIGVVLAGILIWFGYQSVTFTSLAATFTQIPYQTATEEVKPQTSPTIPPTSTDKPTAVPPTATPEPTQTLLPPQFHGLEIPVSVDGKQFLIHMVIEGDQMLFLARDYKTSIEVIQALNNGIPQALWAGTGIVIAPGMVEIDPPLPAFSTYKVTEIEIKIEALAVKLKTDPALFQHYNRCEPGCLLKKGDWVIVPVKK